MYRMIGADGREYGPISADQLREWIGQGRANATTNVLAEGATEWKPLGSLPEFSMLFAAPAPTPTSAPAPGTPATLPSYSTQPLKTNGFAITALVLGILSITFGFCCCYSLPFSIPGLIFSVVAITQINAHPDRYTGKPMAIIGIVLCCLGLLIGLILLSLGMAGTFWEPGSHHVYRL